MKKKDKTKKRVLREESKGSASESTSEFSFSDDY